MSWHEENYIDDVTGKNQDDKCVLRNVHTIINRIKSRDLAQACIIWPSASTRTTSPLYLSRTALQPPSVPSSSSHSQLVCRAFAPALLAPQNALFLPHASFFLTTQVTAQHHNLVSLSLSPWSEEETCVSSLPVQFSPSAGEGLKLSLFHLLT